VLDGGRVLRILINRLVERQLRVACWLDRLRVDGQSRSLVDVRVARVIRREDQDVAAATPGGRVVPRGVVGDLAGRAAGRLVHVDVEVPVHIGLVGEQRVIRRPYLVRG